MGLICFKCEQEILPNTDKFMLGIEIPYKNLWFHRACWLEIKNDFEAYLLQNVELVYNYGELSNKNSKKQGKIDGRKEKKALSPEQGKEQTSNSV